MCGIAGIIRFDGRPGDPGLVADMVRLLHHRGPDDHHIWSRGPVSLGHARLSIIDPTGSRQPMHSADATMHLVYNGEIFNYRELRERCAYPFTSSGDTEVLLALLHRRHPDAIAEVRGQFAFAVYDEANATVQLCRDRIGVLPLYYTADAERVAFASEVKALVPALPHGLEVDGRSLPDYLAHRSVPAPHTMFRGVRKVPPGHRVHIGLDGTVALERYWSLPDPGAVADTSAHSAIGLLDAHLLGSVQRALVADVPVGAYLSGGLDSSLIVAMMAKLRNGHGVETFSAGFADPRYDELPWAREVSERFGTSHHEVVVQPTDFESLWNKLTWHRDAPLSEPADVAVFRLAELARQSVKVVLSGEGSDELFAGYPKHRFAQLTAVTTRLPTPVRSLLGGPLADHLPVGMGRARIALRALSASHGAEELRAWFAPFTERERRVMTGHDSRPDFGELAAQIHGSALRRALEADCRVWLPDNLLERGDRMSMAASLEVRPPFLDQDLVELAFRLPDRLKLHNGSGKWLVKQVARRYLPDAVIDRRKVGFRVPLDEWFRHGLRDMNRDLLAGPDSFVSTIIDPTAVARLIDDHERGRHDESIRLWTLLSLEVWHRTFLRTQAQPTAAHG